MLGAGAKDGVRDEVAVASTSGWMDGNDWGDECEMEGTTVANDPGGVPMQGWTAWWFVQTYLQSLGQVPPTRCLSMH